jgi:diguanylate cyclase (GGDEF)-like protein
MPHLTSRAFTDLAIWMAGFGTVIGLAFPPFCLLLGLPADKVLTPLFVAATVAAGLIVGGVNFLIARLVVGRRFQVLADRMTSAEGQLAANVYSRDWSAWDLLSASIEVDSSDEIGAAASAFNSLVGTLARTQTVEMSRRGFSAILSLETDLDGLCQSALGGLMASTSADAGAMLVVRGDGLEVLASYDLRGAETLVDSEHVRRALRANRIERLAISEDAVVIDSIVVGQVARSLLAAPVHFNAVPVGIVILVSASDFETDGVMLLDQLRADLGLAVNSAMIRDRLERLAAVDPLTDAYNRRFGLARLREEFSRAVRAGTPLGVLMLDIDRFKAVNDTYGHLVGDQVLRAVAGAARRMIREGDVLVRYGGEEFLVLLPGAGQDGTMTVGERIRRAVADLVIEDGSARITVTVSLGAAQYGEASGSPEQLVGSADAALYEAKRGGRDRLVHAA